MSITTEVRGATINLRAPATQRALIDQAAEVQGKSRTDFMLEAAVEKAQQVLLDRTVFALDAKRHARFMRLIGKSQRPSKALLKLLATPARWEK